MCVMFIAACCCHVGCLFSFQDAAASMHLPLPIPGRTGTGSAVLMSRFWLLLRWYSESGYIYRYTYIYICMYIYIYTSIYIYIIVFWCLRSGYNLLWWCTVAEMFQKNSKQVMYHPAAATIDLSWCFTHLLSNYCSLSGSWHIELSHLHTA